MLFRKGHVLLFFFFSFKANKTRRQKNPASLLDSHMKRKEFWVSPWHLIAVVLMLLPRRPVACSCRWVLMPSCLEAQGLNITRTMKKRLKRLFLKRKGGGWTLLLHCACNVSFFPQFTVCFFFFKLCMILSPFLLVIHRFSLSTPSSLSLPCVLSVIMLLSRSLLSECSLVERSSWSCYYITAPFSSQRLTPLDRKINTI